ncbi:SDR family NAD(P)-dependent oxidoreductase [Nocardia stercoris]|uniref:SDR family NAD(P)-dependent oxidoreductase n=1 Tax=Nocardia stercoris TaxID=2483361 RepID=A0A3M2KZJ3_9NOCA|nr:SDR family NAD(P)-dependent oxidoreductase [Nocardia stercoris]RMI30066.1 SDR family NAD(P)-dependent oxidoreductase [Nocardia stercoris]
MTIAGKTVLVTGANRGIGAALVAEALNRGAARVYAGTRGPLTHPDERVTPVVLDVTDPAQIRAVAERIDTLDVLINNAGVSPYDDLSDRAALDESLAVNLYGPLAVTQALVSRLIEARGAIVNILSIAGWAAVPVIPSYSISKAAAFSLTQSQRALLAAHGVRVHAVLTGPVDTDMNRGLDIPKAVPNAVAQAVFAGVEAGAEEIFPDPLSETLAADWNSSATKAMEKVNAALLDPAGVRS